MRIFWAVALAMTLSACSGKGDLDRSAQILDDELAAAKVAPRLLVSEHLGKLSSALRDLKALTVWFVCESAQATYAQHYENEIVRLRLFAEQGPSLREDFVDAYDGITAPPFRAFREASTCIPSQQLIDKYKKTE